MMHLGAACELPELPAAAAIRRFRRGARGDFLLCTLVIWARGALAGGIKSSMTPLATALALSTDRNTLGD
jgi:hypothetical protein